MALRGYHLLGADAGGNWESITYGNNTFVGVANVGSVRVVRATIPVVAATTTTTTSTTVTPTTATPTTVAATTTVATKATIKKTPSGDLPATGTNNSQLVLMALLLVVAGSVLMARRRVR